MGNTDAEKCPWPQEPEWIKKSGEIVTKWPVNGNEEGFPLCCQGQASQYPHACHTDPIPVSPPYKPLTFPGNPPAIILRLLGDCLQTSLSRLELIWFWPSKNRAFFRPRWYEFRARHVVQLEPMRWHFSWDFWMFTALRDHGSLVIISSRQSSWGCSQCKKTEL